MKACLSLYRVREGRENPDFYQILNNDIDLSEGSILNYNDYYYNQLDAQSKDDFERRGMKKGKYKVFSTRIEFEPEWGELRYLFLMALPED
ncbi:hypothetical protein ACI76O_05160 [Capnocytophaga cynodegmi]|uniref:hypothetical protein n=1 Tax=Capnocytophaga cynodegmi TaxID=28189 RepID=UPI00385D828A